MRHENKVKNKGQSLIEYAIIVVLVMTAVMAMSTYVFRAVQSTQQKIQKGLSSQ